MSTVDVTWDHVEDKYMAEKAAQLAFDQATRAMVSARDALAQSREVLAQAKDALRSARADNKSTEAAYFEGVNAEMARKITAATR